MRPLRDTHAFLWWDGERGRLSAGALAACQAPENSLHLGWWQQRVSEIGL